MSDTKGSVDCVTREMNSGDKIASLKEKLAQDHTTSKINGTNGNGSHKSDEINSKDHKLGKVINGVNSKTDYIVVDFYLLCNGATLSYKMIYYHCCCV